MSRTTDDDAGQLENRISRAEQIVKRAREAFDKADNALQTAKSALFAAEQAGRGTSDESEDVASAQQVYNRKEDDLKKSEDTLRLIQYSHGSSVNALAGTFASIGLQPSTSVVAPSQQGWHQQQQQQQHYQQEQQQQQQHEQRYQQQQQHRGFIAHAAASAVPAAAAVSAYASASAMTQPSGSAIRLQLLDLGLETDRLARFNELFPRAPLAAFAASSSVAAAAPAASAHAAGSSSAKRASEDLNVAPTSGKFSRVRSTRITSVDANRDSDASSSSDSSSSEDEDDSDGDDRDDADTENAHDAVQSDEKQARSALMYVKDAMGKQMGNRALPEKVIAEMDVIKKHAKLLDVLAKTDSAVDASILRLRTIMEQHKKTDAFVEKRRALAGVEEVAAMDKKLTRKPALAR